jgi:hypothetical protein
MNGDRDSSGMAAQFYAVRRNERSRKSKAGADQGRKGREDPGGQAKSKGWGGRVHGYHANQGSS